MRPRIVYAIDELAVTCWCESHVVHVPRRLVLAGQTISCGLPACKPRAAA